MHINTFYYLIIPLLFLSSEIFGQYSISGRILDKKTSAPLIGANVHLENTLLGTVTDNDGKFVISNLNEESYLLRAGYVGYKTVNKTVAMKDREITIYLEPIDIQVDAVVVTGTRTEKKRTETPVIVNNLPSEMFTQTNSVSLLDGLNYQNGVRVEIDCQTCNYSQVRLNGLPGAYSQILIDSRPVFSSLNGLYGLEQIPANMLDRVEVIRGGGSALFGSNAIGGTINVITKEPEENSYSVTMMTGSIDGKVPDNSVDINASIVDPDMTSGITLFGLLRNRSAYDANGDGFSEMPKIVNRSFGFDSYYKIGRYSKIKADLHTINETRRGGNKIDEPAYKADQSEERVHNIIGGDVTFEQNFPERMNSYSLYISGQNIDREHYTGVDHADAYGTTANLTLVSGAQFNQVFENFLGGRDNTVTIGVEGNYDDIDDEIPGYNYKLAQVTRQIGSFVQTDWKVSRKFGFLLGLRADKHSALDEIVVNPRTNAMYNITPDLQLRGSFATGFRAPQAFDADMHIAFAGGGISMIEIDPELKKEKSLSYSASIDYNKPGRGYIWGFTLEGFYTRLFDAFTLEEEGLDPDNPENTILIRKNGGNALVQGASAEFRMNYDNILETQIGVTIQSSKYDDKVDWSLEAEGSRHFFKSPDVYGYYSLQYMPVDVFNLSVTGTITGPMYIPHVAGAPGVDHDVLKKTKTFADLNVRAGYKFLTSSVLKGVEFFAGVQNLFNNYQNDFDTGKYRDSNYIYGPARLRTLIAGFKLGY
jgi:outer membrane receptor for ferrienterochelin and colicins